MQLFSYSSIRAFGDCEPAMPAVCSGVTGVSRLLGAAVAVPSAAGSPGATASGTGVTSVTLAGSSMLWTVCVPTSAASSAAAV